MVSETQRADLDRRLLAPPTGLHDFWYPALRDSKVGGKPLRLRMLGEELCFFRDEHDQVAAIWDVCPHRGASLSQGDCHFKGTVACPYHGWVFNGEGECISVLSEAPTPAFPARYRPANSPPRR